MIRREDIALLIIVILSLSFSCFRIIIDKIYIANRLTIVDQILLDVWKCLFVISNHVEAIYEQLEQCLY